MEARQKRNQGNRSREGWSEELGAFKMPFDEKTLDASVLLMPLLGFLPGQYLKKEATIDAIKDDLAVDLML